MVRSLLLPSTQQNTVFSSNNCQIFVSLPLLQKSHYCDLREPSHDMDAYAKCAEATERIKA